MDDDTLRKFLLIKGTPPSEIKLHHKIDSGGVSDIWLATHTSLDFPFIIKYAPNFTSDNSYLYGQFEQEFLASKVIIENHVQRCTTCVVDFDVDIYRHPYLILEYFPSQPLDFLMPSIRDWHSVRHILFQIIDHLSTLHAIGIIHRDLKPANILINESGDLRIIDFALASIKGEWHRFHEEGFAIGTPLYISPEQAYGRKSLLTSACDWYALGVILYEWVCGHPPFKGDTPAQTIRMHCFSQPPPIAQNLIQNTPRELPNIIMGMLSKTPSDRLYAVESLKTL